MASIPDFYSPYYDLDGDNSISQRMDNFYNDVISTNQVQWAEADLDQRFTAGDQTVWSELYGQAAAKHKQFQFNRIQRTVNNIDGYQRRNRKSIIVTPVENGDQETADQFSKVIMWAVRKESMLETISDSFRNGSLITGMNLMHLWMDYRKDPVSGDLRLDNCASSSFIVDPYFRNPDLSDCTGILKRTYITPKEAASLLPQMGKEIESLSGINSRDGKFQFMPENYAYDKRKLLAYDEYWYRDYRTQEMLVDVETGETMEWKKDDEDGLREFMAMYPQIQIIKQEVPTVKLAIRVQNKVVYHGPNPMGVDSYPFVATFGYFNPQLPSYSHRIQGMVRGLRDAQYLYNRRKVIELDILESQINSGYKYKENALVNPADVFNMSGQGKGLALKFDAQMSDVEQILPPQIPPSMIQLSELLAREIQEISGVNEELLGSAIDDKAGVLSMLRQGAGLTTQQIFFDQLDRSQKQLGNLMIQYIQANFTPGKVARIIEDQPTQEFYNKAFGTYDAAVEDGLNTSTQRQMQFAQMLQLKEVGVPISTTDLLEAATIQNKTKIIENAIAQEKQQAEMQQLQMQAAVEEQQAKTKLAEARTIADTGLGVERFSRIDENQALAVERQAEAQKDRFAGILDIVKAMKELQGIDIEQLGKLIALANVVKSGEDTVPPQPVDRGVDINLAEVKNSAVSALGAQDGQEKVL